MSEQTAEGEKEMSVNEFMILGIVGSDPQEVKNSCRISVATKRYSRSPSGEREETTHWHSIWCSGQLKVFALQHLKKRSQIFVSGYISEKSTEKDGRKEHKTYLIAQNIQLCGGRQEESPAGDTPF